MKTTEPPGARRRARLAGISERRSISFRGVPQSGKCGSSPRRGRGRRSDIVPDSGEPGSRRSLKAGTEHPSPGPARERRNAVGSRLGESDDLRSAPRVAGGPVRARFGLRERHSNFDPQCAAG
jgi:hypothetical protein